MSWEILGERKAALSKNNRHGSTYQRLSGGWGGKRGQVFQPAVGERSVRRCGASITVGRMQHKHRTATSASPLKLILWEVGIDLFEDDLLLVAFGDFNTRRRDPFLLDLSHPKELRI